MAIKGLLSEATFPDIVQLLSMGNKDGYLTISDRKDIANIYFKDGKVVYGNIVNQELKIAEILVKEGRITKEQFEQIKEIKENNKERTAEDILLELNLISKQNLKEYLKTEIQNILFLLLTWKDGYFNFEQDVQPPEESLLVSIAPESILLEGARKIDEWTEFERKIPPRNTLLRKKEGIESLPKFTSLTEQEKEVLSLIDGNRTLEEIISISKATDFEILKIIYGLLQAGFCSEVGKKREELAERAMERIEEHKNLGYAFLRTNMLEEAEREHKKIIELDPNLAEAFFYLGMIKYKEKKFKEASVYYKKALEINPRRASVYNNLALIYELQESFEDAENFYRKGIEIEPSHAELHSNLGVFYYKKGAFDKALTFLNRASSLNANLLPPHFYSGLIYIRKADFKKAEEKFRTCIDLNSEIASLHNNLGVVMERQKNYTDATEEYKKAYELDPENPKVIRNIGDIYYKRGYFKEASSHFEKVIKLEETPDILLRLGNISYKNGFLDEAISYWNRCLEHEPENETAKKNLEVAKKIRA